MSLHYQWFSVSFLAPYTEQFRAIPSGHLGVSLAWHFVMYLFCFACLDFFFLRFVPSFSFLLCPAVSVILFCLSFPSSVLVISFTLKVTFSCVLLEAGSAPGYISVIWLHLPSQRQDKPSRKGCYQVNKLTWGASIKLPCSGNVSGLWPIKNWKKSSEVACFVVQASDLSLCLSALSSLVYLCFHYSHYSLFFI